MAKELGERTGHVNLYEISNAIQAYGKEAKNLNANVDFFSAQHVLFAGDSDRSVHADLRGQPHVGLDRARPGAVPQQPADPPARGLHRRGGRQAVGADLGTLE